MYQLLKKDNLIITAFSLFSVILHLSFFSMLEFHRDELLYLSLGEHPAAGYNSVPPFIGLLASILTSVFGYTLFAAKIIPAILSGVMVYLSAEIAKEFKGGLYARVLTSLSILGSLLFLRAYFFFMPVQFDIFFWTLIMYFMVRYVNTGSMKFVLASLITIAIGFLNKYNIVFLAIPLFAVLLFTPNRVLFSSKKFYIGIVIAFIIVLPNILWQFTHNLPVIGHMEELKETQLVNMSAATFLSEQMLMIIPATLIVLPGLFFLLISKDIRSFRFLGIVSVAVLAIYVVLSGKSYYSAGLYPLLIAAGAVLYEKYIRNGIARVIVLLFFAFLSWTILPMGIPVYPPEKLVTYFDTVEKVTGNNAARRDEDNHYNKLPQDYSDMLGWNELTGLTSKAWQQIKDKHNCYIYAENYGQAGAITILGKKYGLPEAVSFNESFKYWIPKKIEGEINEIIYINDEEPGEDIKGIFRDIKLTGMISNPLAREYGTRVYICSNPNQSFNKFWEEATKDIE